MTIEGVNGNGNTLRVPGFVAPSGDFCDGIWRVLTLLGEKIAAAEGAMTRAAAIMTTMRYRTVRFMRCNSIYSFKNFL
jgi:hypothetical protein